MSDTHITSEKKRTPYWLRWVASISCALFLGWLTEASQADVLLIYLGVMILSEVQA